MKDLSQLYLLKKTKNKDLLLACVTSKQVKKNEFLKFPQNFLSLQISDSEMSLDAIVKVIAHKSDFEEEAEKQLKNVTLSHRDVLFAIGMPDLHPGKGYPIGSSIITSATAYPPLIGEDIGCGMSFVKTQIPITKIKGKTIDKWSRCLRSIDTYIECDHSELARFPLKWATEENIPDLKEDGSEFFHQLGTIGGGNHFCELQMFEEILDDEEFENTKLDKTKAHILIHSGSRGYGRDILDKFITEFQQKGIKGLEKGTPEYATYLERHNNACNFARRNRALIAYRFLRELLGNNTIDSLEDENIEEQKEDEENKFDVEKELKILEQCECMIDIWHNYLEESTCNFPRPEDMKDMQEPNFELPLESKSVIVHRKGATPSDKGYVVIPGSRGSYSYLVKPLTENSWIGGYSLAHGAGRKMSRSKALSSVKNQYENANNLLITPLESRVICENKDLLYEEAPEAYKKIEDVVFDLAYFKLVKIVAVLKPLLTYKFKKDERKHDK